MRWAGREALSKYLVLFIGDEGREGGHLQPPYMFLSLGIVDGQGVEEGWGW